MMDTWFDALLDWLGKLICLAVVLELFGWAFEAGLIGFTIIGSIAMIIVVDAPDSRRHEL